ncbi:ParA family protein [Enterovibrio coralii]|uniref:CobQ/CobB/MinD/ParA nucleotide binding domain-containing protein n=1 Tax=Enterovibrio coralii TaxID=294935 RepID=A0A135I7X3_9GAMM|nr:ParA family protein [Enterovibrio coralii]KXF81551.1 hypothetical protein ATN88_02355 [Enterovibrio coralii]
MIPDWITSKEINHRQKMNTKPFPLPSKPTLKKVSIAQTNAVVITIINSKGGVGKSTLTIEIYKHLSLLGYKVEVFDFDKQQSSKIWGDSSGAMFSSFNPANRSLSDMACHLKVNPESEYILIDTPSNFSDTDLTRFIRFSSKILIPMQVSNIDITATLGLLQRLTCHSIVKQKCTDIAIVFNRCYPNDPQQTKAKKVISIVKKVKLLGELSNSREIQMNTNSCYKEAIWSNIINWMIN